jgi:DNA-binding phage protein
MVKKGINFHSYLIKTHLQTSERAAGYLREALEEGDLELLQVVVGDLIEAGYENFKIVANQSHINEETQDVFDVEMRTEILRVKSVS